MIVLEETLAVDPREIVAISLYNERFIQIHMKNGLQFPVEVMEERTANDLFKEVIELMSLAREFEE